MKFSHSLVILCLFAASSFAADIKLGPGTWRATGGLIITVDAAGNQTVIVDQNSTLTIIGTGVGPAPLPVPTPIPIPTPTPPGSLAEVVKTATAAVPAYANKETHRRAMAFGISFLSQGTASAPVEKSRASVRQFCDQATGADKAKWDSWWLTVDAKLNSMALTPASYTQSLGEIAQVLVADLPATGEPSKFADHNSFGLDPTIIAELLKILLPILVDLLRQLFQAVAPM